jgi:hypothetical protein
VSEPPLMPRYPEPRRWDEDRGAGPGRGGTASGGRTVFAGRVNTARLGVEGAPTPGRLEPGRPGAVLILNVPDLPEATRLTDGVCNEQQAAGHPGSIPVGDWRRAWETSRVEPVALAPVDSLTITYLVDNVVDGLAPFRCRFGPGPSVRWPWRPPGGAMMSCGRRGDGSAS